MATVVDPSGVGLLEDAVAWAVDDLGSDATPTHTLDETGRLTLSW